MNECFCSKIQCYTDELPKINRKKLTNYIPYIITRGNVYKSILRDVKICYIIIPADESNIARYGDVLKGP